MAREILETILDQINALDHDELYKLRHAVDDRLATDTQMKQRTELHRALLSSGLVQHVPRPSSGRRWRRPRIEVKGMPVSATIIEERR